MTSPESTLDEPRSGSAFPPEVDSLMPEARAIAARHGAIPSLRSLKRELHVGAPKAGEIRNQLISESPEAPVSAGVDATGEYPLVIVAPESATAPAPTVPGEKPKRPSAWPLILLALPAFVAVWSGWVGLGELTGFGVIHPLPGIVDRFSINTAITLPVGVETYAAYAIRIWLSAAVSARTRTFAKRSVLGALGLGAGGQIAYHLMAAAHFTTAPWEITTAVSALPILVVFAGSGLAHLVHTDQRSTS